MCIPPISTLLATVFRLDHTNPFFADLPWAALLVEVPHGGWWIGAGILSILLGVSATSPVISKPFLLAARAVYRRLFGAVGNLAGENSLRNPRRTTATASALMIGLTLACTMAIIGLFFAFA